MKKLKIFRKEYSALLALVILLILALANGALQNVFSIVIKMLKAGVLY